MTEKNPTPKADPTPAPKGESAPGWYPAEVQPEADGMFEVVDEQQKVPSAVLDRFRVAVKALNPGQVIRVSAAKLQELDTTVPAVCAALRREGHKVRSYRAYKDGNVYTIKMNG